MWEAVKRAVQRNSKFLFCTHRDPDADGVGSEMALSCALEELGKEVVILNPDSLPAILRFMDPQGKVQGFDRLDPAESVKRLDEAEVIFFLDAGQWQRLQPMGELVAERAGKVICIDHHPADEKLTPDSVVDEKASSTGELIYDLLNDLGHPLNERIAFYLYCALVKDTGSFRFENTTTRVFKMAAVLAGHGVKPHEVYDQVFERNSIGSVQCLGMVLDTLRLAYDNRLAYISLTRKMLEASGSRIDETENFVNVIRSIDPVETCIFFRELGNGKIKISFRSKTHKVDVNHLAGKFGGGGHKRASGAVVPGALEEVISRVVAAAADCFK